MITKRNPIEYQYTGEIITLRTPNQLAVLATYAKLPDSETRVLNMLVNCRLQSQSYSLDASPDTPLATGYTNRSQ